MKRHLIAFVTICMTFFATPAAAAEHIVYTLATGFFPKTTYINHGDTLLFVNNSGRTRYVYKDNGNYFFGLHNGSTYRITVSDYLYLNGCRPTWWQNCNYHNDKRIRPRSGNNGDGFISFNPAPTS